MAAPKLEGKIINDMHKVVFYASEYPEKSLKEVAGAFGQMSPIDFNAACWRAIEEGLLSIDKKTGDFKVLKTPETWVFGEAIDHLISVTPYVLSKLAENEVDPEENFYAEYVGGYVGFDVVIAVRYMISKGIIATYDINDVSEGENGEKVTDTYLFYCLPENASKRWGEQQFKDQEKLQK